MHGPKRGISEEEERILTNVLVDRMLRLFAFPSPALCQAVHFPLKKKIKIKIRKDNGRW